MIQFLVAAPCSGSGKTTLTCALLAALKRRGQDPCSFKSGPDYIDPMFHRAVLGVESHNLDLFFSAPETVCALYAQAAAGHGAAVCEGAMGFYDGLGGVSDTAMPGIWPIRWACRCCWWFSQRGQPDAGGPDQRAEAVPHPQPSGGHPAQ